MFCDQKNSNSIYYVLFICEDSNKMKKNTCTKSKFEFGKSFGFVFHNAIDDGWKGKL